jgi:hypothetical protein
MHAPCSPPVPLPTLQVVPPKQCTLCVVVGGGPRPQHVAKRAKAVRDTWLLAAAEKYVVPALSGAWLVR